MRIGVTEIVVIFIVALFVLGPDRLPAYARKMGEALAQFRKYSDEAARDIKKGIVEPLEEAQKPLKEAMKPIREMDQAVRDNVKEVQNSFQHIGKDSKTEGSAEKEAQQEDRKVEEEEA